MSACIQPCGESLSTITRAGRYLLIFTLCVAFLAAGMQNAEAGSRGRGLGIAVGVGIVGAIILNEAARSEERAYRRSERAYRERATRRYYSEDDYSAPARKKKKTSTASKSKPNVAPAPQQDVAAAQPAPQEETAPSTSETAASADPDADNSYLPEADRKLAAASPAPVVTAKIISTPEEIKSAQEHLIYLGYDIPAATGRMDAWTKAAIREFQQSTGAVPTGALTHDQLQALFVKTASQAQTQTR